MTVFELWATNANSPISAGQEWASPLVETAMAAFEAGQAFERERCAIIVDQILKEVGGTFGDLIRNA
jgi:hypothetical protein